MKKLLIFTILTSNLIISQNLKPAITVNPIPSINIDNVTVDEDAGTATFTVSLSQSSTSDVTFNYATADGTAIAGGDYTSTSGTNGIITAGSISTTITVPILDDVLYELSENFSLNLSNVVGATGLPTGTGTILDEATPSEDVTTLNLTGDSSVTEGSGADYTLTLSNAFSHPPTTDVNVQIVINGNPTGASSDAAEGADFTTVTYGSNPPIAITLGTPFTITIPTGSLSNSFTVGTYDDNTYEGSEDFIAEIVGTSGGGYENLVIGISQVLTTIIDNEGPPSVSINDVTVVENTGNEATFTVSLSNPSSSPVTVYYTTSDGTATAGKDYTAKSSSLTFAPGETSKEIDVPILDDAYYEGSEIFDVDLTGSTGATIADGQGIGTITDDTDVTFLTLDDVNVSEGVGTATITGTLTNAPLSTPLTVTLNNGATLTFSIGSTVATSTPFAIQGDDPYIDGESYTVSVSSTTGGDFENLDTTDTSLITIFDTIDTTTLSISGPSTVAEGNTATYTLSVDNPPQTDMDVQLELANVTTEDADFTTTPGTYTVTISAYSTVTTFDVETFDDNTYEGTEEYSVTITGTSGGNFENLNIATSSVNTNIDDNDFRPEIDISGNGIGISDDDTTPSTDDGTEFGTADISGGYVDHTFRITNSGGDTLNYTYAPPIFIIPHTVFSIVSGGNNFSLLPGAYEEFTVRFQPTSQGDFTAKIEIGNDDADENPYNFNIHGTAESPEMDITGNGIDIPDDDTTPVIADGTEFGDVDVAGGFVDHTFRIWNNSTSTLNYTYAPPIFVIPNSVFSLVSGGGSFSLAPGSYEDFTIRFEPTTPGDYSAAIDIGNDDPNENPYNFTVHGTGVVYAPEINLKQSGNDIIDTGSHTFDDVIIGKSLDVKFTIENIGNADLTLTTPITLSGTDASEFSIESQPNEIISAGDFSTFTVKFSPTSVGSKSVSIAIGNDDGNENPYDLDLTGTCLEYPYIVISGYVHYSNSIPVEGVEIAFSNSGLIAVTDENGYYEQFITKGWTGDTTPFIEKHHFNPVSYSYQNVNENYPNQNFTADHDGVTISGYVRDENNIGVKDFNISFSNGGSTVITDEFGYYISKVKYGWGGIVTANKNGWTCTPNQYSYSNLCDDCFNQNFTGNMISLGTELDFSETPKSFIVLPAYPNPFNPVTIIAYGLDRDSDITIQIYDIRGKLVNTLLNTEQQQGWHTIAWNGTNHYLNQVPAGIYIAKISSNDKVKRIKLLLMK